MNITKRIPYRNQAILRAAEGEECTCCCKKWDGTQVFCHFNESWAGKGMGQKADDCAGFIGCDTCHDIYDKRMPNIYELTDADILRAYYRTIRRLLDKGILK